MLFMGSTKYPDENDVSGLWNAVTCPSCPMPPVLIPRAPYGLQYDAFLSKNGGSSNAFTETECTTYHFEVEHEFLKPALDRYGYPCCPSVPVPLIRTRAPPQVCAVLHLSSGESGGHGA